MQQCDTDVTDSDPAEKLDQLKGVTAEVIAEGKKVDDLKKVRVKRLTSSPDSSIFQRQFFSHFSLLKTNSCRARSVFSKWCHRANPVVRLSLTS